jgi:heptosyltransferase-2
MSGKSPKKILVLRFSSIGDIVLTFPVVAALKAAYPDCQIDYVTKPAFRHLLEACPGLSHIFTLESSIRQLRKDINFQSYDAVLDLHNNLRTLLLTAFSGVKVYKYPKNNWNKWLLTRFKIKQERRQHVVERYLSTLKQAFGLEVLAPENPYEIPESEQFSIQDATGFTPRKYVAFAIGAQFATKRLPTDLMIKLLQKMEHPLVLLGGKEDQQTANEIVAELGGQKVISMVGQLNIHGSAWLVKNAAALLTHDTGLMHIGACFEVPHRPSIGQVSFFSTRVSSLLQSPVLENRRSVTRGEGCCIKDEQFGYIELLRTSGRKTELAVQAHSPLGTAGRQALCTPAESSR